MERPVVVEQEFGWNGGIWINKAVLFFFLFLRDSRDLCEGTISAFGEIEGSHENRNWPARNSNPVPPEYEFKTVRILFSLIW
jgi:hypothetical protein